MKQPLAAARRASTPALLVVLPVLVVLGLAPTAAMAATMAAGAAASSAAGRRATTMTLADAPATQGDPLQSPDCRRAIAALNEQEAADAATPRASAARDAGGGRVIDATLVAARRQAATVCLASRADPPLPAQRLVRPPPIAVAPLAIAPPSTMAPPPARPRAALPPPVRPVERPYAVTSCDANGCWANDGSRLNRVGPNLWGPRGICTMQGSLLQCP